MFKDYSSGIPTKEICQKYSISSGSFGFLRKKHNIPTYKKYPRVCDLKFFKQDSVKKIYHWMYDNATIFLERKKEKFNLI